MVVSAALLVLMAFARLAPMSAAPPPKPTSSAGIAGYDYPVLSAAFLQAGLRTNLDALPRSTRAFREGVESLNSLVFESLTHGPATSITFSQNWLAWSLGLAFDDLRQTQRPERVMRGGRGLCHDAVAVLIELARTWRVESQMVDLKGHVLALFKNGSESWVADPDYGFVLRGPLERLSREEGLREARDAIRNAGHGPRFEEAYLSALSNTAGHRIVPGARLSPRLALAERLLDVLAWLIPVLILLAFGSPLMRRGHTPPPKSSP
jgi:hypothetical protein